MTKIFLPKAGEKLPQEVLVKYCPLDNLYEISGYYEEHGIWETIDEVSSKEVAWKTAAAWRGEPILV